MKFWQGTSQVQMPQASTKAVIILGSKAPTFKPHTMLALEALVRESTGTTQGGPEEVQTVSTIRLFRFRSSRGC